MSLATVSQLAAFCARLGLPAPLIGTAELGRALIVLPAGRILGLAAAGRDANLFWTHPDLESCGSPAEVAALTAGGMGGLRLWQAPEAALMWQGPAQVATFANYRVQAEMDPGRYAFEAVSAERCVLTADVRLADHNSADRAHVSVRRIVELVPLAAAERPAGGTGVKLRLQHHLRREGGPGEFSVDLWHLLQLPVATELRVPLAPGAKPAPYFNPENLTGAVRDGSFAWTSSGASQAKVGFAASDLRGGPRAWRRTADGIGVYRWAIPIWPGTPYVDAPPGQQRSDQVVQFWDGFGFCEMEYHSPGCGGLRSEVFDVSELTYTEYLPAHAAEAARQLAAP